MASQNVSGLALSLAAAGGVLVYAGFKGVTPLQALKAVAGGKVTPVSKTGASLTYNAYKVGADDFTVGDGDNPEFVDAAKLFMNDKYTQSPKRNSKGYSDCSSFCAKSMEVTGVPGTKVAGNYRTTGTFMAWKYMRKTLSPGAGDFAINVHHMVMLTGGDNAIGQQNSTANVKTGTIAELMANAGTYKFYTYVGPKRGDQKLTG